MLVETNRNALEAAKILHKERIKDIGKVIAEKMDVMEGMVSSMANILRILHNEGGKMTLDELDAVVVDIIDKTNKALSDCLTVVTSLLEKYAIDPKQIGRLEVGSETVIDKSKSIKTWLMCIFEKCGNTEIEGVDSTNACYGGTAALFNCVNWVQSSSWDGRYGLVVATDSAVYAEGPARPTGGAAAIAMLIGPNAPIAFENRYRGTHMAHAYDFYKPNLASEYPVVDGKLSQTCYLKALDSCYKRFCNKFEKGEGHQFSLLDADYVAFHSPYNKLVQKSFARLLFNDFSRHASSVGKDAQEKLEPYAGLSEEESYSSRDLEKVSQQAAKPLYDEKVQPSTLLPKQVGNMYTASLYAALASIIHNKYSTLEGQRVLMFSYGSGLASTMFSLKIREGQHPFILSNIAEAMDLQSKLESQHEGRKRWLQLVAEFFGPLNHVLHEPSPNLLERELKLPQQPT
ncbi:hypothetical protein KI387_015920, partial [Taxus chinensis]